MITTELLKQAEENTGFQPKVLSVSAINTYLRCPLDYFNKYVLGNWNNEYSHDLVFGNMVHKGIETYYRTKGNGEAVKAAVYKQAKSERMHLHTTSDQFKANLAQAIGMIKENTDYLKTWIPEKIEYSFYTDIPHPTSGKYLGVPLRGRMDLLTDMDDIIDHKTSKALKPPGFYESDIQLPVYKMAFKEIFGRTPNNLILNVLLRREDNDYMSQPVAVKVDKKRELEVYATVDHTLSSIRMGDWIMTSNPGCGFSWCDTCGEESK